MKSDLHIQILPVRMIDEDDACAMNEVFTSYPDAGSPRVVRSNMRDVVLASAWHACRQLPHGGDMNLSVMQSRKPLYELNGRPC